MIELIAISVCTFAAASIMVGQRIYERKHPLQNDSIHQASSLKSKSPGKYYLSYRSCRARKNEPYLNARDRSQRTYPACATTFSRLEDPVQRCCNREETYLFSPLDSNAYLQDARSYLNYLEHRYGIRFDFSEVRGGESHKIFTVPVQILPRTAFVQPMCLTDDAQPGFQNSFHEKESELALHSMK